MKNKSLTLKVFLTYNENCNYYVMDKKLYKPYIISITGTKGKTTVSRLLNYIFNQQSRPTLLVDTEGWYLNNKQLGTKKDSAKLWGMTTTICPGRFLHYLADQPDSVAVLESSIGCSGIRGIGYLRHHISVFTNVYSDHIGYRIKTRKQLAQEKAKFIFKQMKLHGKAVFNADDKYICQNLHTLPNNRKVRRVPVGFNFKYFNLDAHLQKGGNAITMEDNWIGEKYKNEFIPIINVKDIDWTFDGTFKPSIYNLMLVLGVLTAYYKFKGIPKRDLEAIKSYQLDEYGGRLTVLKNEKKNITVICDYAHEKESFKQVAGLAKRLAQGKTIGILRINPDRKNSVIKETGKYIASGFDIFIIYDKVDGVNRKHFKNLKNGLNREKGEVSEIFYEAIKKYLQSSQSIFLKIKEESAMRFAFSKAKKGDVIVHICSDNLKNSVDLVKKYLYE